MNEYTNKYIINLTMNNIHSDCIRLISIICKDIINKLDISHLYLENILNSETVVKKVNFIHSCHYFNLINNIIEYNKLQSNKNNIIPSNKLYTYNEVDYNKTGYTNDEKYNCGKIIEKLNNGVIIYCNKSEKDHNSQIKHSYIEKTDDDIVIEQRNNKIISYYLEYLNILYNDIKNIIYYYIFQDMKYIYININDTKKINHYRNLINEIYNNDNVIFLERNIFKNNTDSYIKIYYKYE